MVNQNKCYGRESKKSSCKREEEKVLLTIAQNFLSDDLIESR